MLKGVYIETVFTSVNGGRPSTDLSVQREDIEALLPAAVNYANTGDYWANLARDNDREIPNTFVSEITLSGVMTDAQNREYLELDRKFMAMPGNGGIRYVQDQCGNSYAPRAIGVGRKRYWDAAIVENFEYQHMDKKLFLFNRPELVDTFLLGGVTRVEDLSYEDELPVAAGMEPQVIDILMSFFTTQRMQPKDYVINGVDPVNEVR